MTRAQKTYSPKDWADVAWVTRQMRVDMLTRAAQLQGSTGFAAKSIGISQRNYVISCRRFGVDIDHQIDWSHPRLVHRSKVTENA